MHVLFSCRDTKETQKKTATKTKAAKTKAAKTKAAKTKAPWTKKAPTKKAKYVFFKGLVFDYYADFVTYRVKCARALRRMCRIVGQ